MHSILATVGYPSIYHQPSQPSYLSPHHRTGLHLGTSRFLWNIFTCNFPHFHYDLLFCTLSLQQWRRQTSDVLIFTVVCYPLKCIVHRLTVRSAPKSTTTYSRSGWMVVNAICRIYATHPKPLSRLSLPLISLPPPKYKKSEEYLWTFEVQI